MIKGEQMIKRAEKVDVGEVLVRLREQLAVLEGKIDTLIARSQPAPIDHKMLSKPVPAPVVANAGGETKPVQGHGPVQREKVMHKAVCADCRKDCEVPFQPKEDRPVYCKECFSKRRNGQFRGAPVKPANIPGPQPVKPAAEKPAKAEKKAAAPAKKKAAPKAKKSRK
jgi:CxxC-x17-CxxC domain-containing protein